MIVHIYEALFCLICLDIFRTCLLTQNSKIVALKHILVSPVSLVSPVYASKVTMHLKCTAVLLAQILKQIGCG